MSTDNKYQFKGTPGPWVVGTRSATKDCVMFKSSDTPLLECEGFIDCNTEANAHLISAAPDLLEFAVMMLQSIDGGGRVVTVQDHHIDELRAAIHKALNIQ